MNTNVLNYIETNTVKEEQFTIRVYVPQLLGVCRHVCLFICLFLFLFFYFILIFSQVIVIFSLDK